MQTGPAFLGAPVSHTLGPKRAAVPGQDCLESNTCSRDTSREEWEGAHLWGGLQRGKTILTEVTTEWGDATHSAGTRSPFISPVKSGDTPAWASGASPGPGRPSLHTPHAKGPRGVSRSRRTGPLLALPGRPGSLQRARPASPSTPLPESPPPSGEHPAGRPGLQRGAPIPRGPRACGPGPHLSHTVPVQPRAHSARRSDTPASRSGPHGPVKGARDAQASPALCTWFPAPSRGEGLPRKKQQLASGLRWGA